MNNLMKLGIVCDTIGDGHWSREARAVRLTRMEIHVAEPFFDDDLPNEYGELQVYFDRRTWSLPKHGLIYTDTRWMKEFRARLVSLGFSKVAARGADYSEQGMQSNDYVSLDVNDKFIKAWKKLNNE